MIERYRASSPAGYNTGNGSQRDDYGRLLQHSGDPSSQESMLSSVIEKLVRQELHLLSATERRTIVEWMQKDPFLSGQVL